jgi:hypothetical protein
MAALDNAATNVNSETKTQLELTKIPKDCIS